MKKFALFLCGLILLLLSFLLISYLFVPKFAEEKREPFQGEFFYNPYQNMDTAWYIANFHAHSKSWGFLTDGRKNHLDSIYNMYYDLGYTYINISNYNKITLKDSLSIPCYEHGVNIFKRHQLCIGAKKVMWFDLFFWQKLKHKQHIINQLKETAEFVAISHPAFSGSFEPKDFSSLYNYDAIEVFNHYRISVAHWDSALSSGYYAVLLANDDLHDISKMNETGVCFTIINNDITCSKPVIEQLKKGAHYGVRVALQPNENLEVKRMRMTNLVIPKKIDIVDNFLNVELNKPVKEIRFIGQNGVIKQALLNTHHAAYQFVSEDTYIRIEVFDYEGNFYIFNPVVKTSVYRFLKSA
jgi:hypothetical protein